MLKVRDLQSKSQALLKPEDIQAKSWRNLLGQLRRHSRLQLQEGSQTAQQAAYFVRFPSFGRISRISRERDPIWPRCLHKGQWVSTGIGGSLRCSIVLYGVCEESSLPGSSLRCVLGRQLRCMLCCSQILGTRCAL